MHIFVPFDAPPLPQIAGAVVLSQGRRPTSQDLGGDVPSVILLAAPWLTPRADDELLAQRAALVVIGDPATTATDGLASRAIGWIAPDAAPALIAAVVRGAMRHAQAVAAAQRRHVELTELTNISAALSTERDIQRLLAQILEQARRLSRADAGSLYLVERGGDRTPVALRFALAQNNTLPDLPFRASTVPLDASSLAGYVASSGEPLLIDDVYRLGEEVPYRFNRSFDDAVGYRTRSMLVLPMRTHRDEIVGVLQLINRKRDADAPLPDAIAMSAQVIPFDDAIAALVGAMTSQAAVAIENGKLYEDIARLFDGFVTASVHAIEQRDPTTAGHSSRVTAYTLGLADALNRGRGVGQYAHTRFSARDLRELRYACLLHDFGKVAVREAVLQKEKKLYPADLVAIRHRFSYLLQAIDLDVERQRNAILRRADASAHGEQEARLDEERAARRLLVEQMLETVLAANEPRVLADDVAADIASIAAQLFVDEHGVDRPLLEPHELALLSIRRGSLDTSERVEIESHAQYSYEFLQRIPWTPELRDVPAIVWGHHEKLNGRGYPRGVGAEQLGVQTRMMTIADIFDALVAADRPYKRAIPIERALDILREEAAEGALDADLLETFIRSEVWVAVSDEVRTRTREAQAATPRPSVALDVAV